MQFHQKIAEKIKKIRLEMFPPPHKVKIDKRAITSYADLEKRIIGLAEKQLEKIEWVYRHEILHLDKYPRTIAKDLYWSAKIANRLSGYEIEFFKKRRNEVMNIAEDAVIDYRLARYMDAHRLIRKYVEELPARVRKDPPPHEHARMIAVGDAWYPKLREYLEKGDVVSIGVMAVEWLMKYPSFKCTLDLLGKPSSEDYEQAAGELIVEGEDISPLDEFAREEGVDWSFEKAAIYALVKSYDWYLSASRHREIRKRSRARQTVWNPGDDVQKLDVNGSLTAFPKIIPGLTAVKREAWNVEGYEVPMGFKDVAILVDESGSMRGDKTRAVKKVGVSLLAYVNRLRIQFQIIGFGQYATVRVPFGFNYIEGVKYFVTRYSGYQDTTEITPALPLLMGRQLLVYVISDAEIFDLYNVKLREDVISEVVLVLISYTKKCEEFVQAFGKVPVRGYWIDPNKVDSFIIRELGRLS